MIINWREGKGGFVGASKRLIKGFFSYAYSITTDTVDPPQESGNVGSNRDISLTGTNRDALYIGLNRDISLAGKNRSSSIDGINRRILLTGKNRKIT